MSMSDWITLNVGGTKFSTTRSVLTKDQDSMLAKMFEHEGAMQPAAKDKDGAYLIDGNPDYFKPILQFLRRGELIIDPGVSQDGVLSEARYFGVQSLVQKMENNNNDVTLNVGGTKFTTTRSVLTKDPDSKLAKMLENDGAMQPAAKDKDGAYLIDGNPKYFEPILQFLRRGEVVIDQGVSYNGVWLEAKYFGVQSLVNKLENAIYVGTHVRVNVRESIYSHPRIGIVQKIDQINKSIFVSNQFRGYGAINAYSYDIKSVEIVQQDRRDNFLKEYVPLSNACSYNYYFS